jgi:hypothetical protein
MQKIMRPVITIEQIIEEISYEINPVNLYAPLQILDVGYETTGQIKIIGKMEPLGTVTIQIGSGETLNTTADSNGEWTVITEEPNIYEMVLNGVAFAISPDGIQYDTESFVIPPNTN